MVIDKSKVLTSEEETFVSKGGLLPRDVRAALEEERELVRLLSDARLQEMTAIVEAYESGAITWKEADKRWAKHTSRWDVPFTKDAKLEVELRRKAFENVYGPSNRDERDSENNGPRTHSEKIRRTSHRSNSR